MGPFKRILTALTVLVLVAAACSDDTVDQATVDSVVDDITPEPTDSPEDPPEETEDPPEETEDPPEETENSPEETALEITGACLLLRHYSSDMWTEYPYFASLIVNTNTTGNGIIVTHNMVTDARFTSGADGSGAGFEVNWPVEAPGPVPLPSSIEIDGVELLDTIVSDHLEGLGSFVAMASDFTDEWIVPDPCPFDIPVPAGNTLG